MFKKSKNKQSLHKKGSWDAVWEQKSTLKKINFLRKVGYFYIDASSLLSKYINNYVKSDKKYSVIELGCGGSSYLPYLQKKYKNFQIYGIDKSLKGCKSTLIVLNEDAFSGCIVCGDIFQTPFNKKFDIVFSVGLIEHFDKPDSILEKHVELLKPGGILICIVPNFLGFQGKFYKLNVWKKNTADIWYTNNFIWGIRVITISEMKTWFKNMDLQDIKVHPFGGFFPVLLMESYNRDNQSLSIKLTYIFYRFFLFIPIILLNIPFVFRLNSLGFSPFIIGVGYKKK
jgi:2-polyprenyl-3-methyl-5-hydroxy-6-metoxy-1,4-benzoquinol methylase